MKLFRPIVVAKVVSSVPRARLPIAVAVAVTLAVTVVSGAAALPADADPTATATATSESVVQDPVPVASPEQAATTPAPVDLPQASPTAPSVEDVSGASGPGAHMGQGLAQPGSAARGLSEARPLADAPGVQGQDVSGWQASPGSQYTVSTVNWSRQWSMGSRFVYVKASEGSSFVDRSRTSHLAGARSVGMLTGAYHFALPGDSTAKKQADHFVNNGGGWTSDGKTLAPLLDIENNPYTDPYGSPYLGNNCYNLSPAAMVAWIKDFSTQVQARTGRLPVIYTNYYWWQECTGNTKEFSGQALHIAAYGASSPWIPGGWRDYAFWQYSSTGPFDGDSNVWNGTLESLKSFASNGSSPMSPPSILSGADVVAADSAGTLWNYPATSSATLGTPTKIGAGWQNFRSINVVDWNADGVFDLVAQWNSGALNVYRGLPGGGFQAPLALGTGWAQNQLTIGFWLSASQYPQILSRTPSGTLQLWTNNSGAGIGQGPQIGQGWAGLSLTMVDTDGDGRQDIVAGNSAGDMVSYRSDGAGKFVDEARRRLATGWQNTVSISVSSGFVGASSSGLVAKDNRGNLNYVPVPGNSSLGQAKQIGVGWGSFRVAGGEEISWPTAQPTPSIKSASDIVVADKAGTLWRHANKGAKLGPAEKIGVGFGAAKSIHVLDWNADGTLDLLYQSTAGSLAFFAGLPAGGFAASRVLASTGWADADVSSGHWIKSAKYPSLIAQRPDGSLTSYTTADGLTLTAGQGIGHGFLDMHPVMTDFDGDGNTDVGVIDRQGKLIVYRSNGQGSFIPESRPVIGVGWQGMTSVSPAAKFTSPNSAGLLARTAAGGVFYYPVSASRFATPVQLASGWGEYVIGGSSTLSQQPNSPLNASDVVSADSAGTLWCSRATGTGNFAAGEKLGHGWINVKALHVVDWNADGVGDVLTQWNNGAVTVHIGLRTGGLGESRTLAASGWAGVTFVTGNWLLGSKYPGLLGTNSAGNFFYWPNDSGTTIGMAVQIGNGWGGLSTAMIDFDKNGTQDVLSIDSTGYMRLYRGTGSGGFVPQDRPVVGNGWGSVKQFSRILGYSGAGSSGLMTVVGENQPRYYPLTAPSTWGAPKNATVQFQGSVFSR